MLVMVGVKTEEHTFRSHVYGDRIRVGLLVNILETVRDRDLIPKDHQ